MAPHQVCERDTKIPKICAEIHICIRNRKWGQEKIKEVEEQQNLMKWLEHLSERAVVWYILRQQLSDTCGAKTSK